MHIIKTYDVCLCVVAIEAGMNELSQASNKEDMSLHCSVSGFMIGTQVAKSINDSQDKYAIYVESDKYLKDDAFFLTDGEFIVYSEGA